MPEPLAAIPQICPNAVLVCIAALLSLVIYLLFLLKHITLSPSTSAILNPNLAQSLLLVTPKDLAIEL